jgi:L,D-transpeptidase catalytic domain
LSPRVLDLALAAATCAQSRKLVAAPKTLTIIDYSLPSTERRLWVLDLQTGRTLYEEVVAHGRGSGGNMATAFSNAANSHQTSLGLFVTEDTYIGQNGYSMRLNGLEPGVNDQARARAIVMHGAPYVDPAIAAAQGRLGRSWGCPALRPRVAKELIDHIKGGNLLFSYYPDKGWLSGSQFLAGCS